MLYTSTRDKQVAVTASFAIANGISKEGGLYLPQFLPQVSMEFIASLSALSYAARAKKILELFLTDYSEQELDDAVTRAYAAGQFEDNLPAPLASLTERCSVLELWHGPTCAFKDMALQILPHLMAAGAKRALSGKQILILVATSGDTGKAALEGFCDAPGISIAVFYPDQGVSAMQRLQMASQHGENVAVYAIEGNFDDAQSGVKAIFGDKAVNDLLAEQNILLSSANSINWGRLVPQIVYYFSAYADLLAEGKLKAGERVNFVVPTGNFGNILAGYYAMKMGLPVNRFVCASNQNNILTDFIQTGEYDARRNFYTTLSPSMDILISSNLERLLFDLSQDDALVSDLMRELKEQRHYHVSSEIHKKLTDCFYGVFVNDADCQEIIRRIQQERGYLCDTHTAVAVGAYERYHAETGDETQTVIVSTASPYKFAPAVLEALGEQAGEDEFAAVKRLSALTGTSIPAPIAVLEEAKVRFTKVISPADMANEIIAFAKGE